MPLHATSQASNSKSQGDKDVSDLASQLAAARTELASLQERYDALRADRDRLAQTLGENMRKWKRFKRWMFTAKTTVPPKVERVKDLGAKRIGTSSTPSSSQQPAAKMLETPVTPMKLRPKPAAASPRRSPLSQNRHVLNTPRKIRTSPKDYSSPSIPRLKRTRDENEDTAVEEMSQTQEDSQALSFWRPSTPSQRARARRLSISSCPPTPQRSPALHSPPPTKRPRRSVEPFLESASAPLPASSRYKRARGDELPAALNAEFEIDPAANGGALFAFDQVVRGRRHRHGLNAGECEECCGWYAAVGPLPPRLEAPRWSSPSPSRLSSSTLVASELASHGDGAGSDIVAGVSAHRKAVSRHRAQWERAPTPPGYWDIGFPDTQAVERINEQAAELHRRKRDAVAREADEVGGRYRRRT